MPPVAAIETRVLDAMLTALGGIGTPPSSWLTTPYAVLDGVPGDEMGRLDLPRLFVQHVQSAPDASGDTEITRHNWTLTFNVWVAATTMRAVLAAKADVLRAIYAAEGTFMDSFRAPLFPSGFAFHDELVKAGTWLGTQTFTIDVETGHADP